MGFLIMLDNVLNCFRTHLGILDSYVDYECIVNRVICVRIYFGQTRKKNSIDYFPSDQCYWITLGSLHARIYIVYNGKIYSRVW